MKVVMPQEIEVWYVLPAIRKELAEELVKKGMKQKDIAEKLGITESAVSQYIKKKRAKKVVFNKKIKTEIRKAANMISGNGNPVKEIQRICDIIKEDMLLCKISKNLGLAPRNCKKCFV